MTADVVSAGLLLGAAVVAWSGQAPRLPEHRRQPLGTGVRRARAASERVPLGSAPMAVVADLVAALLAAGLPTATAVRIVKASAAQAGLAEPTGLEPVLEALRLADETGVAPAALVRAAAVEQRRTMAAAKSVAAQRLSVMVVLPMGLCLLPAFLLLTVAPLVLALLHG